jgi:hypothetical protein
MGRARTRFEKHCPNCGIVFLATYCRPAKYCSRHCYFLARIGEPRGPYAIRETKHCEVCGTEFIVGGVGNPKRTQRFCSDLCQRRSRYRRGRQANILNPEQRGYLAGIIDGEGSIILYKRRDVVAMMLMVSNTGKMLLDWIAETTGVGAVCAQYKATQKRKATWFWRCNADAAESVLKQIRPHLVLKTAQADLALKTQERLRNSALKADRTWQEEWRQRMRALNRRGPHLTVH